MKRIPVFATFVVLFAVAIMIRLGFWQLEKAELKNELIETYAMAPDLPAISYPSVPVEENPPYFRRSSVNCLQVLSWRAVSGRNISDESGWAHIAHCKTLGGEGPGAWIVAGWSRSPTNPKWDGGVVDGIIAPVDQSPMWRLALSRWLGMAEEQTPDSQHIMRLVASEPVGGLEQSRPPSTEDIRNNHMSYVVQWFLFAGIALIIYILALRQRNRTSSEA